MDCVLEWCRAKRWRHPLNFACFVVVRSLVDCGGTTGQNKLWKLTGELCVYVSVYKTTTMNELKVIPLLLFLPKAPKH